MLKLNKLLAEVKGILPNIMGNLILIVEDEKSISDIIKLNLEKNGFSVSVAYDGEEALNKAMSENPDLILLDVMLPKMDGFSVCNTTFLTGVQDDEVDKVLGLELGADDYMTKPFSLRELMARVKATLRRSQLETKGDAPSEILEFGDLKIDTEKYEVSKRGVVIDLTFREYELLKFIATKRGKIFTRETLLNNVWDYDLYLGDVRTVDVTIRRLREKIEDNPSIPTYVMTKRGVGYYFGA